MAEAAGDNYEHRTAVVATNNDKGAEKWWGTALAASPPPKILTYLLRTSGWRNDRFFGFCRILKSTSYLFSMILDSPTPAASTK